MRLRSGTVTSTDSDVPLADVNDSLNLSEESVPVDLDDISTSVGAIDSPIKPCGKCVTCNKGFLNVDPIYFNNITGEKFVVTETMTCKSTNIVYLIRCAHVDCAFQYVGQSVNSVNTRCIGHRSGMRTRNEPKFLLEHFTKVHNPSDIRITPLFTKLNDSPTKSRKSQVKLLKKHEDETTLLLNTLFPYGLNDRLEKPVYIDADVEFFKGACVYKIFPKVECTRYGRGKGNNTTRGKGFNAQVTLQEIYTLFINGDLKACRTIVAGLGIMNCTILGNHLSGLRSADMDNVLYRRCCYMVIDMCNHFCTRTVNYKDFRDGSYKSNDTVNTKSSNCDYIPVRFTTKEVEALSLIHI